MTEGLFIVQKPDGKRTKPAKKQSIIDAFRGGKLSDECRVFPAGSESFLMIEEFVLSALPDQDRTMSSELPPVLISSLPTPVSVDSLPSASRTRRQNKVLLIGLLGSLSFCAAIAGFGWIWIVTKQRAEFAEQQRIEALRIAQEQEMQAQEAEERKQIEKLLIATMYAQNLAIVLDRKASNQDRSDAMGLVVRQCVEDYDLDMEFGAHAPKLTELGVPNSTDFKSGVVFFVMVEDDRTLLSVRFNDPAYFTFEKSEQFLTIRKIGCLLAYQLCETRFKVIPEIFTEELTSLDRSSARSLTKEGPEWSGTMETAFDGFTIMYKRK